MTLSAVFAVDRVPCLISDYLETSDIGRTAQIPTYQHVETLLEAQGIKATGLVRKAALISPWLVVAGSGNGEAARKVIDRLYASFSGRKLTRAQLKQALAQMDDLATPCCACRLVGWIIEEREHVSFRWDSTRCDKLQSGGRFVEGSGRELFQDIVGNLARQRLQRDARFEGAIHACLQQTGTCWANEVLLGNTLANRFGAGFDIFVYDGKRFRLLSDVTYLLFGIEFCEDAVGTITYRIWPMPLLTKTSYIEEHCFLRVLIPPNVFGIPSSKMERVGLVRPLVSSSTLPTRWPSTPIRDLPFTSGHYVCCFTGRSVAGDAEVFTAVASGQDATQFKIHLTGACADDLEEIKFEFPDQIMNNMLMAAVRAFERHGTRFPTAL